MYFIAYLAPSHAHVRLQIHPLLPYLQRQSHLDVDDNYDNHGDDNNDNGDDDIDDDYKFINSYVFKYIHVDIKTNIHVYRLER
jgi:hypothetical protein